MLVKSIRSYLCVISARAFLIFILLLSISLNSFSQNRAQLESKRAKILEEIRYTERLLNTTKKNVSSNISDLTALKRKIALRESLINNIKSESRIIDRQLVSNRAEIDDLRTQLLQLKANYSESIEKSYRYQKANQKVLFVLGAESFNQAIRRLNYVKKIGQKRKEQAKEIEAASAQVQKRINELEKMSAEKQVLLTENKIQLKSLDQEKASINTIIASLRKEEQKYKDDINKKAKERAKLDKEIQRIIEREIAAAEAAKKAKSGDGLSNTPDPALAKLSKDFYNNKGKLPWPVEKGYISKNYGKYPHPELKNIQINNTGIDIRTSDNAAVRAVFKGEVVTVMSNPTFKNAVIIKHGEYFSVYTGLGKVSVKKGSKVSTKQIIGSAYSGEGEVTEVHLEIWKGKTKTNPSTWIYKN